MHRPIRVVVAKPGLDGHDRGAKIIACALRDAGVEVIYTGLHQTPQQVVDAAMSEDADFIGMSILSGAHMTLFSEVMDLLKANDATDIVVFGGGIIPEADIPTLRRWESPESSPQEHPPRTLSTGSTTVREHPTLHQPGSTKENCGPLRIPGQRTLRSTRRTDHRGRCVHDAGGS